MENVRTILCDLPFRVKAYTIKKDDFYTIVLNQNLSEHQNRMSYYHELFHIKNGDFDRNETVNMIELFAHQQ